MLADYEGLDVGISYALWLLATLVALLLGLIGIFLGAWPRPKPRAALWLGCIAAGLETAFFVDVNLAYHRTVTRYSVATAAHFKDEVPGWLPFVATLFWVSIPMVLGWLRRRRLSAPPQPPA